MRTTTAALCALAAVTVATPLARSAPANVNSRFQLGSRKVLRRGTGPQGPHPPGQTAREMAQRLSGGRGGRVRRQASALQVRIVVTFDSSVDATRRAYFTNAAAIWESFIPELVNGIDNTGTGMPAGEWVITISASFPFIDGPFGVLASAGPQTGYYKNGASVSGSGTSLYLVPDTGIMQFDSADLAYLEAEGTFEDVIIHEMGHVLGLGTLWNAGSNHAYISAVSGSNYVGTPAVSAYCREVAGTASPCTGIPIEQGGGSGTAGGHWDEVDSGAANTGLTVARSGGTNDLRYEIMTGWLNAPLFMSAFTCKSFRDGGFNCVACVDNSDCGTGFVCGQDNGWLPARCVTASPTTAAPTDSPTVSPTRSPTPPPTLPPCNNNGVCDSDEDCNGCPADCVSGSSTGNAGPNNGVCEPQIGETCLNSNDCRSVTNGNPRGRYCCGDATTGCSDSRCNANGFQCDTDATTSFSYCCGDSVCAGSPFEDSTNCANDCTPAPTSSPTPVGAPPPPSPACGLSNSACSSNSECCSGNCRTNGRKRNTCS